MVNIIEKPWGSELIWAQTDKYVGKVLRVKAGCRLSKQYHKVKDETLIVISGEAFVEFGDDGTTWLLTPETGSLHIPRLMKHRIEAITDCEIVEVSTPELDDVVRLEDDYGRG